MILHHGKKKKSGNLERLGTIMNTLLESIYVISYILEPFIPDTAKKNISRKY